METIIYKGFAIKIKHDSNGEDPFTSWDGNLPLMYRSGNWNGDYSNGGIGEYLSEVLTDNQVIHHQKKLAEIFDIDLEYFKDHEYNKEDKISDIRSAISGNDNIARFVYLCEIANIDHLCQGVTGYSQGDYATVFVVPTNTWRKEVGYEDKVTKEMMQDAINLWSYWAWGDIYGYVAEDLNDDCTEFDSCWGFYGHDHNESGLLESAKSEIDAELNHRAAARFNKLKQFIRAGVPLYLRDKAMNKNQFKLI